MDNTGVIGTSALLPGPHQQLLDRLRNLYPPPLVDPRELERSVAYGLVTADWLRNLGSHSHLISANRPVEFVYSDAWTPEGEAWQLVTGLPLLSQSLPDRITTLPIFLVTALDIDRLTLQHERLAQRTVSLLGLVEARSRRLSSSSRKSSPSEWTRELSLIIQSSLDRQHGRRHSSHQVDSEASIPADDIDVQEGSVVRVTSPDEGTSVERRVGDIPCERVPDGGEMAETSTTSAGGPVQLELDVHSTSEGGSWEPMMTDGETAEQRRYYLHCAD